MAPVIDAAPISIRIDKNDHRSSISVRGRADRSNISKVVSVLDKLAEEDRSCVSLDLDELESIDNAALEGLAGSVGVFKVRRKRLHLRSASSAVKDLLEKLQLTEIFCHHDSCTHPCSPESCSHISKTWEVDVFSLASVLNSIREARDRVDRIAESVGFSKCHRADIVLGAGEAITNAIKYGSNGDSNEMFTVSCIATPERICISISDDGLGFCLDDIPSFEDALFAESGRGVHCMNAVMDEVSFDFTSGTTVRMAKQVG
ncbi:MAG: ATP-binding protein [Armatimonadetes bacterium]|nr:ATP-binding protein [Armatimonadota bacterium]